MALTHLLDTSVLVEPAAVPLDAGAELATSVVCVGELEAALLMADTIPLRSERLTRLRTTTSVLAVLDVGPEVAGAYGVLRASTRRRPSNDLWIAATANAHGLVLVTRDEHLARLPGVEALLV